MRETKFRAWDDGKMIYEKDILHLHKEDNDILSLANFFCNIRNDSKIMQFTGLHDENRLEIYNSDIISDNVGIGVVEYVDKKGAFRVNYKNGKCKWFIDFLESEINTLEIIGNLYEHPHLINS